MEGEQAAREYNLPNDVTCNILSRLPARDVAQLNTVSKNWRSLLSEFSFRKLHYIRSLMKPKLVLVNQDFSDEESESEEEYEDEISDEEELEEEEISGGEENSDADEMEEGEGTHYYQSEYQNFVHISIAELDGETGVTEITFPVEGYVEVMSSANGGLVCFANSRKFYIFNPTSKRFATLPEISPTTCIKTSGVGFGFDDTRNEYTFVHLFDRCEDLDQYEIGCEVLSMPYMHNNDFNMLHWRAIAEECPHPVNGCGVWVDNKFFWLILIQCGIISLDLATETFSIINLPNKQSYDDGNEMYLMQLSQKLFLVDFVENNTSMELWYMENASNGEWVFGCRVYFSTWNGFDSILSRTTILGFRNGDELAVRDSEKSSVDYFNFMTATFRSGPNLHNMERESKVCLYTENLFFLNF